MRVLALGGSLRSGSLSSELLRGAAAAAPEEVEVVLYEGLKEIPPYDADLEWAEPSEQHAAELMRRVYDNQAWATEVGARGKATVAMRRAETKNVSTSNQMATVSWLSRSASRLS